MNNFPNMNTQMAGGQPVPQTADQAHSNGRKMNLAEQLIKAYRPKQKSTGGPGKDVSSVVKSNILDYFK